ncbi:MAG: hypothetical protein RLZZ490_1429 [Cyanobacteriota bacterium]
MTAKPITAFFWRKSPPFSWSVIAIVIITTAVLTGIVTRDVKKSALYALASLPGLILAERWRVNRSQQQQSQWQSSLQETIHHQEMRLLELEHYEAQLNQAIAVAQQMNQSLQCDNQTLKSERFLLGQQISGLKQRWDKLSIQFASLQPQKQQLEQELATLTQALQQGDRHKQTIEKNLRDSSQQLQQIEHSCHAIQGELSHLSQAVLDKQQQYQILKETLAGLESHCQTLQERQASLTDQEFRLVNHIQSLETQRVNIGHTHDRLATTVKELQAQKQTLTQEIGEQERQKRDLESCLTYLRHEYDQIQGEIAEMSSQCLEHTTADLCGFDEQLTPSGLS